MNWLANFWDIQKRVCRYWYYRIKFEIWLHFEWKFWIKHVNELPFDDAKKEIARIRAELNSYNLESPCRKAFELSLDIIEKNIEIKSAKWDKRYVFINEVID